MTTAVLPSRDVSGELQPELGGDPEVVFQVPGPHDPIPRFPDPEWDAYWRIDPRPDGNPAPAGPPAGTVEDELEYIAAGQAVAIVPVAARSGGLRADLTTVPLDGVDPGHVVLATRAADRSRLVATFRKSARECLTAAITPR